MRRTRTRWEALVLLVGAVVQVLIALNAPRYVVIQGERFSTVGAPNLPSQVDLVQFAVLSVTLWVVLFLCVAMIRSAIADTADPHVLNRLYADLRHEQAQLSARLDRLER